MAVTLSILELAIALRVAGSGTTLGDTLAGIVGRLLGTASAIVLEYAPDLDNDDVQNEAVIRIAAYLHDNDAARNRRFSDVLALSGAASILSMFRVQRAVAIDGSTPGGGTGTGLDTAAIKELIADALAAFRIDRVFGGFNLPAPAIAFRIGWSQTMAKLAEVFTRVDDHPIDGASVGDTDGLAIPPFPPALNTDETLHLWIWVAGDPKIADLLDDDTSYLEFMTDEGALTVEGVAGHGLRFEHSILQLGRNGI